MSARMREDPRVARSRAAVMDAARTLFLRHGFAGTTVDAIAAQAGLTKRTVYNHYADKETLFARVVEDVIADAEDFAAGLEASLDAGVDRQALPGALDALGRRLALAILRPEVVALRRLLVAEGSAFPELAADYFERAPGRVIAALARRFAALHAAGRLEAPDARLAAGQFAYLVAGEPLDRAVLLGTVPPAARLEAGAREGVETFLARYLPRDGAEGGPADGPGA